MRTPRRFQVCRPPVASRKTHGAFGSGRLVLIQVSHMTRWAGLGFGERLKVSAACRHKIILRPQQAADFHPFTPEDSVSIYLFVHSYMTFFFIVIILLFLQPTFSPMTEGHCPCQCDRRSDTLTGQLRLYPQDCSARPLLHPFYCAAQSFQLAVRRPRGPHL